MTKAKTALLERPNGNGFRINGSLQKRLLVIGGGTGSYNVLSGLKQHNCSLTAVVAMTDSGGSSGRLRDEFGHLPPGDLRQCLLALSRDDHSSILLRQLFNFRFSRGNGLEGHSFGNLFLTALTEITGSTELAVIEAGRLLGIKGTVLPVTLTNSNLCARLAGGSEIVGEANIDNRTEKPHEKIDYVYLSPKAFVYALTAQAIEEADAVIMGPGDLYTSIVPNLLVDGVPESIQKCKGKKIYVCNLMTKHGESDGFKVSDFIKEIQQYLGSHGALDYVLVNSDPVPEKLVQRYAREDSQPVEFDEEECRKLGPEIIQAPLLAVGNLVRHDASNLAKAIFEAVS